MSEGPQWFAPRRGGYGSGIPISWQGWATTILYIACVIGIAFLFKGRPLQRIAAIIPPTLVFCVVCARTTKGGWRWRSGDED